MEDYDFQWQKLYCINLHRYIPIDRIYKEVSLHQSINLFATVSL